MNLHGIKEELETSGAYTCIGHPQALIVEFDLKSNILQDLIDVALPSDAKDGGFRMNRKTERMGCERNLL